MLRLIFLSNFLILLVGSGLAQIEDASRNALPPGPARISGLVLMDGEPVADAIVRLEFGNENDRSYRDFKSHTGGGYTVYINRGVENPEIVVIINGEEKLRYVPESWHQGSMQRKNLVIP